MKTGNQINKKGRHHLRRRARQAGLAKFRFQVLTKMKKVIASGDYVK